MTQVTSPDEPKPRSSRSKSTQMKSNPTEADFDKARARVEKFSERKTSKAKLLTDHEALGAGLNYRSECEKLHLELGEDPADLLGAGDAFNAWKAKRSQLRSEVDAAQGALRTAEAEFADLRTRQQVIDRDRRVRSSRKKFEAAQSATRELADAVQAYQAAFSKFHKSLDDAALGMPGGVPPPQFAMAMMLTLSAREAAIQDELFRAGGQPYLGGGQARGPSLPGAKCSDLRHSSNPSAVTPLVVKFDQAATYAIAYVENGNRDPHTAPGVVEPAGTTSFELPPELRKPEGWTGEDWLRHLENMPPTTGGDYEVDDE